MQQLILTNSGVAVILNLLIYPLLLSYHYLEVTHKFKIYQKRALRLSGGYFWKFHLDFSHLKNHYASYDPTKITTY